MKTTPKPRATKNSRGDCVVVLLLPFEPAAVDAASVELVADDATDEGVGVIVVALPTRNNIYHLNHNLIDDRHLD